MFPGNITSYVICKSRIDRFTNSIDVGVNDLKLQYFNAQVIKKQQNGKILIMMGRFVDSREPFREEGQIAEELLGSGNFKDIVKKSGRLAGRYVLICVFGDAVFVLPDATATIPVTYTVSGDLYISSNPKIVANVSDWSESILSRKIKSRADQTHPLPYNMTMYDQIKKVPPNHYLDCGSRTTTRFYPLTKETPIPLEEVAKTTNELLQNIVAGYHKRFKLSLPLTSGFDSRTILSLCKDIMEDIPTYTFLHHHFSNDTADISIPQRMSKELGFTHLVLLHTDIPYEVLEKCHQELGSTINDAELQNAWTYYNSKLYDFIRLDGNVSTLGRCDFGRNLPEILANPSYLITKTHNYAKENKKKVQKWVDSVWDYAQKSNISKYDLFYWEHRAGNWAANSYLNSDLMLQSLNIFNCRHVIELWLRVPRAARMNGGIHKKIMELNWPELLKFPFNPDQKYKILYSNSLFYYFGVRCKYILESFK